MNLREVSDAAARGQFRNSKFGRLDIDCAAPPTRDSSRLRYANGDGEENAHTSRHVHLLPLKTLGIKAYTFAPRG